LLLPSCLEQPQQPLEHIVLGKHIATASVAPAQINSSLLWLLMSRHLIPALAPTALLVPTLLPLPPL